MAPSELYLLPYLRAAARHGANFPSLLWASPQTQAARFDAIVRLHCLDGLKILDAGCGRADLLDYLLSRGFRPAHYIGIEAIPTLAHAAREKRHQNCTIISADFVREPGQLRAGADVTVFCGSLNTLEEADFRASIRAGFQGASLALIFNFLSSPRLAAAPWLRWREPQAVLSAARSLTNEITTLDDYMEGDCTIALRRGTSA